MQMELAVSHVVPLLEVLMLVAPVQTHLDVVILWQLNCILQLLWQLNCILQLSVLWRKTSFLFETLGGRRVWRRMEKDCRGTSLVGLGQWASV